MLSKGRATLPVDASLASLQAAIAGHPSVVLKAEPGAGKTTRVPPALLDILPGRIIVLEPRRLAARLSAERIASELGEACGGSVGYQVRFASVTSAQTRLLFVTEGLFLRMVLDEPTLPGTSAIIIDEFHERHLHTDLALAIVRSLQQGARPDLKLVVMSATLATEALAAYLGGAPVFDIPGRTFPVAVDYLPLSDQLAVEARVVVAVKQMLADQRCSGDILVFLTGMQDIRRSADALVAAALPTSVQILPLAADLPYAEQAQVFAPSERRKVVLSTNVAETSLTLPGVTGVIDLGLAKIAGHASWSGMPTLDVKKISQASAVQRTGRAGRVAPGVAYRVYSESDFLARAPYTLPDVRRLDLAEVLLAAHSLNKRLPGAAAAVDLEHMLPWFEPPEAKACVAARQLLTYLGALDSDGRLTPRGRAMAVLPMHPRLQSVVVQGQESGCANFALAAACLIGEGMLLRRGAAASVHESSDVLHQIGLIAALGRNSRAPSRGSDGYARKAQQILDLYQQLARRLRIGPWPRPGDSGEDQLILCLLAGFPERVAKRRALSPAAQKSGQRVLYNFCLGRGGFLAESSVVQGAELILALDAAEVQTQDAARGTAIYVAASLTPDTLLGSPAPLLSETTEIIWQDDAQRVDLTQRLSYGQLTVSEVRAKVSAADRHRVESLLREKLREHWPKPFEDASDLLSYHARVAALRSKEAQEALPIFTGDMLELLQAAICEGKRSFREISERSLISYIEEQLPEALRQLLNKEAPHELRLSNGKRLKVSYNQGTAPFVTGFIQDFYGVVETPRLGYGNVLTVHLLAPNRRAQQVTNDLAGFWQRHYPALRSEFGRRYPRHYWPDDPRAAKPFLYYNQVKALLSDPNAQR